MPASTLPPVVSTVPKPTSTPTSTLAAATRPRKRPEGFPKGGENGVPESVSRLSIAVDSWGTSELNPWALSNVSFLGDYFNLRLMMQAPNGELAPAWAAEFELTEEGVRLLLNPDARFQDGNPADAEALKNNLLGFLGNFVESSRYDAPLWNSAQAKEFIGEVRVISPTEIFIATDGPKPTWMWVLGGNGFHLFWYGNPNTLLQGPEKYLENPAGGGPYMIAEWDLNNRILFARWEEFWADYDHWHNPQAMEMELLAVPEPATRYALLTGGQVEAVYNLPWGLAKGLDRSEEFVRGVNPGDGGPWTQTYQASVLLAMTFGCPIQVRETAKPAGRRDNAGVEIPAWTTSEVCEDHPTLDQRVRRALNLAVDKQAISEGPHFGFSRPIGSIFHAGSFGARQNERVQNVTLYDPTEAKRLLAEAGHGDGFELVGHYGRFAGRPGIPEAADAIASSWKDIGVNIKWQEHDSSKFVRGFRACVFSHVPVSLQTWGRKDHAAIQTSWYHATSGYVGVYNDVVEDLYFDSGATFDPDAMKEKLALLEDEVLGLEETIPLYSMSAVNAYTDRVLSHPTVEFSAHFKHYDLVLLRD